MRQIDLSVDATVTVEREQLIGRNMGVMKTATHTLSMTWPDLDIDGRARVYSLQKMR